ncbi:MAG: universal stress protein [Euryarchaeota archaeon]|nr:universal stress protein [Euryarchaeota archaeon]
MYKKILLATDGSPSARKAEDHAIEIAKKFGSRLEALYVIDPEFSARIRSHRVTVPVKTNNTTVPFHEYIEQALMKKGEEILGDVKEKAEKEGIRVDTKIRKGNPAEEIIREAEDTFCEVIVMGSKGLKGLSRAFIGSVADKVSRRAPCPVLVIRE